ASPGYCWHFQGSRSVVLIRLSTPVQPVAITIQHNSKIASSLGTLSSAPQDFTVSVSYCWVLGGLDEEGKEEILLGTFIYTVQKDSTQTFLLQNGILRAFEILKLVIWSNWGRPGYTCIHQMQVHGRIA
ncbi:SUN2 protein, partial [Tricholaema leucomelas]|nr:SUN2 protein [Tricholaema leucomelas]